MDCLSDVDFGLIGYPLGHSFSKTFFTEKFAREGKKLKYENFEMPTLDPTALYSLVLLNLCCTPVRGRSSRPSPHA